MKVRLKYKGRTDDEQPQVVRMVSIPRAGEFLLSGNKGMVEVVKVIHTPGDLVQDIILELKEKD